MRHKHARNNTTAKKQTARRRRRRQSAQSVCTQAGRVQTEQDDVQGDDGCHVTKLRRETYGLVPGVVLLELFIRVLVLRHEL
eukprot:CAMPEP_0118892738 /NCGR_PEP_ID=MMETSP1166-20130328/2222_1 /TAXON_ID=1104430 /ORGANISM="Chrysoreinhardia sp, Strain CCMP3193" /LENGTH=81 /DNA_ID=CAMNT_0006831489 /DNA_START=79 /DNA_END=320 /DNA_ORIENTATION=-